MLTMFFKGMSLSASLIMAIGAQNAHVLKMGLQRQHIGLTVAVCVVCEALLISMGVVGIGQLIERYPASLLWAKWGGVVFLCYYGIMAFRAAWQKQSMQVVIMQQSLRWQAALVAVLGVTLLNPHVYLDTVILLGSIAVQQGPTGKWWFALGATVNALLWYSTLAFAARLLRPLFARERAWQVLDLMIALMMLGLALNLAWA